MENIKVILLVMKNQALFPGVTFVSKSDLLVDFPGDVDSNDFKDDGGFFCVASLDFEDGVLFCADILI